MKIAVVGTGYVGMSNACLLASKHQVVALDIDEHRVELINNRVSPVFDVDISELLHSSKLNLRATVDPHDAYSDAEYIIIATSTNYDPIANYFDTSSVEKVARDIQEINPAATVVIKSTTPIGFTESLSKKLAKLNILFSPEFLREGQALYDNLYPSRIIVGGFSAKAQEFADLLRHSCSNRDTPIILMSSTEAESVKLFANTFLAMRVAFFNELDSFCESMNLNPRRIIEGICLDSRIGDDYNNPSFGYGGYCLPKDTKQLLANFKNIPQTLISAVIESNEIRMNMISSVILSKKAASIGIYRLVMKSGSDNFRSSSIIGVIELLLNKGVEVIIFEPKLDVDFFMGIEVVKDLNDFKGRSELIVANRYDHELSDVVDKIYTRDIFGES